VDYRCGLRQGPTILRAPKHPGTVATSLRWVRCGEALPHQRTIKHDTMSQIVDKGIPRDSSCCCGTCGPGGSSVGSATDLGWR
jgi:hypothetical protein